jgi:copper(I)-binding protein
MKPGGLHMMFMGVKKPLAAGEKIKATLTFEKAGSIEIEIPVVDLKGGMQHKM